jgi:hypothetical protein
VCHSERRTARCAATESKKPIECDALIASCKALITEKLRITKIEFLGRHAAGAPATTLDEKGSAHRGCIASGRVHENGSSQANLR